MKVWINRRSGGYSGGMILVAANSAEEAHKAFHDTPEYCNMWTSFPEDGYISDAYYYPDGWEEMPMLEANVDKPQVLAEEGYTE